MSIFCDKKLLGAHRLLKQYENYRIINLLSIFLDNGYDVNSKGTDGFTLLYQATEKESVAMVRLLISRGANVNALVFDERNPTTKRAVRKALGQDIINIDDEYDMKMKFFKDNHQYESTALDIIFFFACRYFPFETEGTLACCKVLLENGALVNRMSPAGEQHTYGIGHELSQLSIYIISAGAEQRSIKFATTEGDGEIWTRVLKGS